MYITVNRFNDSITGAVMGRPYGVQYKPARFNAMKALAAQAEMVRSFEDLNRIVADFMPLTRETFKQTIEDRCPWLYVDPNNPGKFFLRVGNGDQSLVSSEEMPIALVNRITQSVDLNIDIMPILKCWVRFLKNPNYTKEKATLFANYIDRKHMNYDYANKLMRTQGLNEFVAQERATVAQTPITMEGLLCTYKVSREHNPKRIGNSASNYAAHDNQGDVLVHDMAADGFAEDRLFFPPVQGLTGGDPFWSGKDKGHFIRVGRTHRLDHWGQVDCNDSYSCVRGMHVGNLDYIRSYQAHDTVTHNIFIDPMNIGAVAPDSNGDSAMRVIEYFVHSAFSGVNRSIYHSSDYAKETSKQYQKMFEDAVKNRRETDQARHLRITEEQALKQ